GGDGHAAQHQRAPSLEAVRIVSVADAHGSEDRVNSRPTDACPAPFGPPCETGNRSPWSPCSLPSLRPARRGAQTPSQRRIARETLCPPKPKLLLRASRTGRSTMPFVA